MFNPALLRLVCCLALCLCLGCSSDEPAPPTFAERPVPSDCIVLGEIALSGEIRPVAHAGLRLKESAKLGFESGWVPKGVNGGDGLRLAEFANLRSLVDQILGR